jgi:hypothetical protein
MNNTLGQGRIMISKFDKFKATAWEKAGKYDAGHNRRVLLALLIGIGTIAWLLLKFIWTFFAAILGETNRNSTTNSDDFYPAQNKNLDTFGRKQGDIFYGHPTSNLEIVADMNKNPQH